MERIFQDFKKKREETDSKEVWELYLASFVPLKTGIFRLITSFSLFASVRLHIHFWITWPSCKNFLWILRARELRPAWHTTNLGYDQNFCFDLRPNLELRPAPACDYHLFPKLKEHLSGRRFSDDDEVKVAVQRSSTTWRRAGMTWAYKNCHCAYKNASTEMAIM
jgi:hypothetical protein